MYVVLFINISLIPLTSPSNRPKQSTTFHLSIEYYLTIFPSLFLAPSFIKILRYFMVRSIWKDWKHLSPWIKWKGARNYNRVSIKTLNVWWYYVIQVNQLPLAKTPYIHAQTFFKWGVATIAYFYSWKIKDWIPWDQFKSMFCLNGTYKCTYDVVINNVWFSIWSKIGAEIQKEWWKASSWHGNIPLHQYKSHHGIIYLCQHFL